MTTEETNNEAVEASAAADLPVEAATAAPAAPATENEEPEAAAAPEPEAAAAPEPEAAAAPEPEAPAAEAEPEAPAAEAAPAETTDEDGEPEEEPAFVNPNWKWYIVHTYSGYENRARQCLLDRVQAEKAEEMFGQILIPTENVVEMKKGAKRTSTRKFFPGYMMVQMELTDDTWHLVKNTQKITGFVGGTARRPRPIPESEVLRVTEQMEEGTTKPKTKQTFEEGQQVRVNDGPFMNFTGTVEEVRPDKQKLRVLVSIFGRATPVELDFMQVESV